MRLSVTTKLVLVTVALVGASSFVFTAIHLGMTRADVEEDLRARAVVFAREIAATISDRRELESGPLLLPQIVRIMEARPSVLQLDILAFEGTRSHLVASSHPAVRLPFTREDGAEVRGGNTVSRLITTPTDRYWEVMAPIHLEGGPVGAIGAKFSTGAADRLAARIRRWTLSLTALSVLVSAVLTAAAARLIVARPVGRLLDAVDRFREGRTATRVRPVSTDELGQLADHVNLMLEQITRFNDELQHRVAEATRQLDRRLRDVSRLNEQLFHVQGRLRHAERLALAGRFMAQIAHEVGTPLHSIAGHLELLRRGLSPAAREGDAGHRLAIVETQLTRVSDIIARFLDMTRGAPGMREPVDLNALVTETAELIRPGVTAKGLGLDVELSPQTPVVEGRKSELQQVLLNLLTNAVDATTSGRLMVGVHAPSDGHVEIEVRDTGPGITAEALPSLFEPFFTTKAPGRGTGLGLYIAVQIAREHGGEISVDSHEGEGSTFRVHLPTAVEART